VSLPGRVGSLTCYQNFGKTKLLLKDKGVIDAIVRLNISLTNSIKEVS